MRLGGLPILLALCVTLAPIAAADNCVSGPCSPDNIRYGRVLDCVNCLVQVPELAHCGDGPSGGAGA